MSNSTHVVGYESGLCVRVEQHAMNQAYVSEWSNMNTKNLLLQWISTIKTPHVNLEQNGHRHDIIQQYLDAEK